MLAKYKNILNIIIKNTRHLYYCKQISTTTKLKWDLIKKASCSTNKNEKTMINSIIIKSNLVLNDKNDIARNEPNTIFYRN